MLEINVLIRVYMEISNKYTEHSLPVPQDLSRGPYRSPASNTLTLQTSRVYSKVPTL